MKVRVDIETMPKDAEVTVQGLGVLHNGNSYDFDAAQTQMYCELNGLHKAPETLYIGKQPKKAAAKATEEQAAQHHPVDAEDKTRAAEGTKKEGK